MAANLSRDDESGVDTEMQTKFGPISAIEGNDCIHHIESGPQGAFGIVLVHHRRAKQRHDLVANELVDGAVVFLHHRHQPVEAGVD